jgi:hypothetical protein
MRLIRGVVIVRNPPRSIYEVLVRRMESAGSIVSCGRVELAVILINL